jgi:hypothetical protein
VQQGIPLRWVVEKLRMEVDNREEMAHLLVKREKLEFLWPTAGRMENAEDLY